MTDHADLVFMCPLVICVSSFREMFISILCPLLLNWAVFLVGLYNSLYILDRGSHTIYRLQIFPTFRGLSFHVPDG